MLWPVSSDVVAGLLTEPRRRTAGLRDVRETCGRVASAGSGDARRTLSGDPRRTLSEDTRQTLPRSSARAEHCHARRHASFPPLRKGGVRGGVGATLGSNAPTKLTLRAR